MPVSARDRKRVLSHKNAELSRQLSDYDTIFSSTPKVTLAQTLRSAFTRELIVPFILFIVCYLLLFFEALNSIFILVGWVLLAIVFSYFSDLYLNRGATTYSMLKSILVNVLCSVPLFLIVLVLYFESLNFYANSLHSWIIILAGTAFSAIMFYLSIRYSLATTARMRVAKKQWLNSFDVSWHLLDNSMAGIIIFKLVFNALILVLVVAGVYLAARPPIVDMRSVFFVGCSILLAFITAVYMVGKKETFELLASKIAYYNPQA